MKRAAISPPRPASSSLDESDQDSPARFLSPASITIEHQHELEVDLTLCSSPVMGDIPQFVTPVLN